MRKATWGALALALFAVATMRPLAVNQALHGILSLGLVVGYLLLSLDPIGNPLLQRRLMIAGILCGLAAFVLVQVVGGHRESWALALLALADVLAVAVVALPLWQVAGPTHVVFAVAAGVLAVGVFLPGLGAGGTSDYASVAGFALVIAGCALAAWRLERPAGFATASARPPRVVWGRDIVTLSTEEKAERLARLDARLAAGELEEHRYWDLRQELESR